MTADVLAHTGANVKIDALSYTREHGFSTSLPSPSSASASPLVLVFGASSFHDDTDVFARLREALPHAQLVGCSTAGEILDDKLSDESLAIAVVHFDSTELRTAVAPVNAPGESHGAGVALAQNLRAPGLRAVLVFSDGKTVNGSALARGLNHELGPDVVVTGGLAGDGARFQRTWVLVDDRPQAGFVTAVGLYGSSLRVAHGSRGGWDLFGPERMVTRASGNVLYELDGRPALQLYKEYLGERVAGLPATALLFPLAIREAGTDRRLVRTILDIDETSQSMIFAGDVPQGSLAQLMRANFDRLVQGASDAAQLATQATGTPVLSIAVSCVGRRLVLRQRAEEELQASLEALPPGTRQVGFYSYGELSPLASGSCELHNQTMTLTTLSEQKS